MSSKLDKGLKNLTKNPYRIMLSVIGSSPTPLSSYQIKKQMQGSRYVYSMVRKLTGIPDRNYSLDKILSNANYRKRVRQVNPLNQREFEKALRKASRGPRFLKIHVEKQNADDERKWKYSLNFRGLL